MDNRGEQARKYARVTGSPGEWARFSGLLRALWPLFLVALACGYLARELVPLPPMPPTIVGFLFILLAGAMAWLAVLKGSRLKLFMKGAQGEECVARELGFLPAAYAVFHGVGMGRRGSLAREGDVDHVVVGPTGIFAIETKNWSGEISVRDGLILRDNIEPDRQPLEQVKAAAVHLRQRLGAASGGPVVVHPIVCFAAGRISGGCQGAAGVIISDIEHVNGLIQERRETSLSPEAQAAAVQFLESATGAGG